MSHRTTIVLDDASYEALRELRRADGCSASEAVRRAVLQRRERELGVPLEKRRRRKAALLRLIALMDGQDADAEIARIKAEDEEG
jgi:predicted CopG family antitoxin